MTFRRMILRIASKLSHAVFAIIRTSTANNAKQYYRALLTSAFPSDSASMIRSIIISIEEYSDDNAIKNVLRVGTR